MSTRRPRSSLESFVDCVRSERGPRDPFRVQTILARQLACGRDIVTVCGPLANANARLVT